MRTKKTKNLSKKTFTSIVIIFILLLSLISIFSINFNKKDKLSQILENNNSSTSKNTISNDTPTKVKLKTLSDDDYKYCETITDDQRLAFLNINDYSIEDRIRVYLNNDINNVGLIYYDIESKENISINADKEFVAASTYKLTLNLLTYHLASIGELDLSELVEFTPEDYVDGTGILYYLDTIGPYTIQELLDLSLIYSDNIAADMLSRILGGKSHVRSEVYKLLNIDYGSKENIITPNVELTILNYIYDNKDN
ncbi:MAG: serine hydrolase, partial [Anaeroplasmataceae bacterium]